VIDLPGNASAYTIVRVGSSANLAHGDAVYTIPVGTAGMSLVFDDGTRSLVFDAVSGSMKIGAQSFGTTAAVTITAPAGGAPSTAEEIAGASSRVFVTGDSDVALGGNYQVIGTANPDRITYLKGHVSFDSSFNRGGDEIVLSRAANAYTASVLGSSAVLTSTDGTVTIPVGTVGLKLVFTDDTRTLLFDTATSTFRIDGQAIGQNGTPLAAASAEQTAGGPSLDQGTQADVATLTLQSGAFTLEDNAARTSNVRIVGFGRDDMIHVTGAASTMYNFTSGDADRDGKADDLMMSFSGPVASNLVAILDAVPTNAFIYDEATAKAAVGWNFISFG